VSVQHFAVGHLKDGVREKIQGWRDYFLMGHLMIDANDAWKLSLGNALANSNCSTRFGGRPKAGQLIADAFLAEYAVNFINYSLSANLDG